MVALDTSVLAYSVNRFAPEHPRASRVVEDLLNGELPWALPWPVVHEFLHLVTHPHAVARPLRPAEASAFVEQVLASPSVQVLSPGAGHEAALIEVLGSIETPGGLPEGLAIAVILREHGVRELLSADRGMQRFPFLSVVDPVHGPTWVPGARPARRYRVLRARGVK